MEIWYNRWLLKSNERQLPGEEEWLKLMQF